MYIYSLHKVWNRVSMIRIWFHEIRNCIRNLREYPIVTYERNILKTKKINDYDNGDGSDDKDNSLY